MLIRGSLVMHRKILRQSLFEGPSKLILGVTKFITLLKQPWNILIGCRELTSHVALWRISRS